LPVEERALGLWQHQSQIMLTRPFAGDVVAVLGTDGLASDVWQTRQNLSTLHLSGEQLWRQAQSNLNRFADSAELHRYSDRVFWVSGNGIPAVALIFSNQFWRRAEFGDFRGQPVLLQGRDHFLVGDSADPEAIAGLQRRRAIWTVDDPTDYPNFVSRSGAFFARDPRGVWTVFRERQ
jgi:hypothetical protein